MHIHRSGARRCVATGAGESKRPGNKLNRFGDRGTGSIDRNGARAIKEISR